MGLTLVTPPTVEPVTLEEAKAQVRVTGTDEEALISRLISAATRHVERMLDLSLTTRTYKLTLDAFSDYIELPRGPVQSVTSVQYVDANGDTQTVPADDYTTDLVSSRNWLVRNSGESWPVTLNAVNVVSITYVAGFDEVPAQYEDLRHAILLLVGHWFSAREAVAVAPGIAAVELPLAVDALIQPYRAVMV